MAEIKLINLTKKYGNFTAVENINLNINDGEFLVILGPSGCGKTTTMRMIAGLETVDSGEIFMDAKLINHIPPRSRDLAMVFQNYALYPHMSVEKNIEYPLKVRGGIKKKERKELVLQALKKVELENVLNKKPGQLSGGQRQRVALARAIVRSPKLFLMDEPLSNLDAKLRTQMRGKIKHLHQELKTTIVYVTHDQVEAMTLGDRISVFYQSKIQQIATPEEIYNFPSNTFVAGFIGSPPMNLLEVKFENNNVICDEQRFQIKNDILENKNYILGQRPEDFSIVDDHNKADLIGKVYNYELIGDCCLINIKLIDSFIIVKSGVKTKYRIDEKIGIKFNVDKLHFFDINTKKRINHV